jgi:hypothetical protein
MPVRILIDESLPRKLKGELLGYDVKTVPEMGWAGKKNGELLSLMTGNFDVFVTADQNLTYQQNLESLSVAIAILVAPSNRLADLLPLMPKLKEALETIQAGDIVHIGAEDERNSEQQD